MVEDERTKKKILSRVDDCISTLAKMHDELLAIKRAVEGTNPVKEALTFFDESWMQLYQRPPSPSSAPPRVHYEFNAADAGHCKRLLTKWSMDVLKQRMTAFFADRDHRLTQAKHPFNWFIARINQYTPRQQEGLHPWMGDIDLAPGPSDCKHRPRCRTDFDCTQRRNKELRA